MARALLTSLIAFAATLVVAGMFMCWADGYPALETALEQLAPSPGPTVSVALTVAGLVALGTLARRVEPRRCLGLPEGVAS